MSGYHEVRTFVFDAKSLSTTVLLPDGFKPFAAEFNEGVLTIIARKWHRRDK